MSGSLLKKMASFVLAAALCVTATVPSFAVEAEPRMIGERTRTLSSAANVISTEKVTEFSNNTSVLQVTTATYPSKEIADVARGVRNALPLDLKGYVVDAQTYMSFQTGNSTVAEATLHSSFYYDGSIVRAEYYYEEHYLYNTDDYSFPKPTLRHDYTSNQKKDKVSLKFNIKSLRFGAGGFSGTVFITCDQNGNLDGDNETLTNFS